MRVKNEASRKARLSQLEWEAQGRCPYCKEHRPLRGKRCSRCAEVAVRTQQRYMQRRASREEIRQEREYSRRLIEVAERDPSFRPRVIEAYGHECLVCRYDVHVEAAHIISVASGGGFATENGRPLCRNHHWEVDHGNLSWEDILNGQG